MDSNYHFIKDITTGKITKHRAPIIIGKGCWINAGSVITKGAVIPDYSILARNTFVGKDLTSLGTNNLIAGSPAKIIRHGVQRIIDYSEEKRLMQYFNDNPEAQYYQSYPGLEK